MTRVKKATNALKTRKNILRKVKGYRQGRSTKERMAQDAISHAGAYAFAHRRDKKGDFRRLWNVRIGAAAKANGTSYSKLMGGLHKNNILLNRKVLSELAASHPETFKRVAAKAKQD